MRMYRNKEEVICSYESAEERNDHIIEMCHNGYTCTSFYNDENDVLVATFFKEIIK